MKNENNWHSFLSIIFVLNTNNVYVSLTSCISISRRFSNLVICDPFTFFPFYLEPRIYLPLLSCTPIHERLHSGLAFIPIPLLPDTMHWNAFSPLRVCWLLWNDSWNSRATWCGSPCWVFPVQCWEHNPFGENSYVTWNWMQEHMFRDNSFQTLLPLPDLSSSSRSMVHNHHWCNHFTGDFFHSIATFLEF